MSYTYALNCGEYVLHDPSGKPCGPLLQEVALALDTDSGVLHKHGPAAKVEDWVANTKKKFADAGFTEMADQLTVLKGRFTLDDLNRCLSTTGYVLTLYKKAMAGELQALDMFGKVITEKLEG